MPPESTGEFIARRVAAFMKEVGCLHEDTTLKTDWEDDSKGEDKLCGHRFHDAIFALADAWTETTESQE